MATDVREEPTERYPNRISRRTLLGAAALTAGGGVLAACSSSASAAGGLVTSSDSLLKQIQQRGQLNVVMQLAYPPQMYRDSNNQPAGYDVEILKIMAKELNVKLNIVDQAKADTLIPALLAKQGDIVMVGLVNTPTRALTLSFSHGYVPYGLVVIVPNNSPAQVPADLNKAGVTITCLVGSTSFFRAQLLFPKANVQGLEEQPALLAVATGKSDGAVVEQYLATPFLAKYPNVKMLNGGVPISVEFGCIGLRQDDQPWLNWLNNWVAYHTDSGELPGLYRKIIGLPWVQAT